MKAKVDPETCIGCELCVQLCPEVFEMDGDVAVSKEGQIPADAEECCEESAENCPTAAIEVIQ